MKPIAPGRGSQAPAHPHYARYSATVQDLAAELLDIALVAAREAGAFVSDRAAAGPREVATKSSPTDMVTEVDLRAERIVAAVIRARRPGDAISGEETGDRTGSSGVRWLVDPLDGTTNFLYGYPAFCVSVAAIVDGEVVAGAVYDAIHGVMYHASRGNGAFRDGTPLSVSGKSDLATALVGTGFGYDSFHRANQGSMLAHVLPRIRDIRRSGAAALDLCAVASGRLDAYYEAGVQPWDWAAGGLIVEEAGGSLFTVELAPPQRPTIVACSTALAGPLEALLLEAAAQA